MNLDAFKSLVDTHRGASFGNPPEIVEDQIFSEMRGCFSVDTSSLARADVKNILDDLALRYLCDGTDVAPYIEVADAINLGLRSTGLREASESDWNQAIKLGLKHAALFKSGLPLEQRWVANTRVCSLSKAILKLRALGFTINFPLAGDIDFSDAERKKLAVEIERLGGLLGSSLLRNIVKSLRPQYSSFSGRFKVGRDGKTLQVDAKPELPLAYLYQLGIRFFNHPKNALAGENEFYRLIELVSCGIAVLDVTTNHMALMFSRPSDIMEIMQKSLVYDSVFLLPQAKVAHVQIFLTWLLSHQPFSQLKDTQGLSTEAILNTSQMLLAYCEQASCDELGAILPKYAAYATGLDVEQAKGLLENVFTHVKGANLKLSFPPNDLHVDSAFRPILKADGHLIMQPPSLAARAILNASLEWCRAQWKKNSGDTFDESLGKAFELFVREQFTNHGVLAMHGSYRKGKTEGECDLVVESEKSVIFFELKSKVLTRKSRTGDDISALVDLADSLVRPQAQAMERQAFLHEHGQMQLTSSEANYLIEKKDREVFRVSLTRGELGSLHDRPFLQKFLIAGCVSSFSTIDPKRQAELANLISWFSRFNNAAKRADQRDFSQHFPFSHSWSLSIFQLLLLLERTEDSASFTKELIRTRNMVTPTRDFYTEYEYMLSLEQHRSASP